ncbi:dihydrodipicolinate synthase family protein [Xylophilus sp. GW821-FHT01B05]
MSLANAKGLYIVAQTPFTEQGAVDLDSIDTLADFYLRHGANGFTVLGVAGESVKLTPDEALAVAGRYIARAGGKPVVVGVSNASIANLRELTARVMDQGAAGVMIAPPHGLKTEDELFAYFSGVFAQIGDVPTVLQDYPASTGVWMSVPSILRLIEAFPQIQVLKEEDLPSLGKISRLRAAPGRRIAILTGNNGVYLPQELARGIDGPMAGFSYPEMLSGVYRLYTQGQVEEAHDLFDRYLPLLNYENQSQWGVAVRKEVLRRRGAIRSAAMRQPGPKLSAIDLLEIDRLVRRVEAAALLEV